MVRKTVFVALLISFLVSLSSVSQFAVASKTQTNDTSQSIRIAQNVDTTTQDEVPLPDGASAGITPEEFAELSTEGSTCESSSIIGWVLCTTIRILYSGVNFFYNTIILQGLQIDPLSNESSPSSPESYVYAVWSSFRVLANILFIGIFLLALIGQSFSWFLTPYELKKILPRLFIGAIGIQLSWYIVGFTIDFFNVLGAGIRGLILVSGSGAEFNIDLSGPSANLGDPGSPWFILGNAIGVRSEIGVGDVVGIGGGAIAGRFLFRRFGTKGLVMGLNLILLPILLLIIVVSLIVAVRKIVVLLLIALSPIAFALWILPGTQSMFNRWWELFWKTLLMYPLIIALIAMGRLTSQVVSDLSIPPILSVLVGVVSLFAPFVLIPSTFKFAGSILSAIGNGMGGAGKGISERLLGDPHSEFSYRGRMHHALEARNLDNKITAANKAKPAQSALGQASQAAKQARARSRRAQNKRAIPWLTRLGDAGAGAKAAAGQVKSGNVGVGSALGALAIGAQMRMGPGLQQAMAERNAHKAKGIQDLAGYDSSILFGILSGEKDALNPIANDEISLLASLGATGGSGKLYGAEPLYEDRAAVQATMGILFGRLSTEPQMDSIRERLEANHHLPQHVKEDIWQVFRVSDGVEALAPETRYRRLDGTYEFEPPSRDAVTGEYNGVNDPAAQRAAAIEMATRFNSRKIVNGHLAQARSGTWSAMNSLDEVLESLDTGSDQEVIAARAGFDQINSRVEETAMDEVFGNLVSDPRFASLRSDPKLRVAQELVVDPSTGKRFLRDKTTELNRPVYDLTDAYTAEQVSKLPSRLTPAANEARIGNIIKRQATEKSSQFDGVSRSALEDAIENTAASLDDSASPAEIAAAERAGLIIGRGFTPEQRGVNAQGVNRIARNGGTSNEYEDYLNLADLEGNGTSLNVARVTRPPSKRDNASIDDGHH